MQAEVANDESKTQNQHETKRRRFTKKDDDNILKFVAIYGPHAWPKVHEHMPQWSVRQLNDRYRHYLDPSLNLSKWTPEEDKLLLQLYLKYGPKWATICNSFDRRNCVNVKNRWALLQHRGFIQPQTQPSPPTPASNPPPKPVEIQQSPLGFPMASFETTQIDLRPFRISMKPIPLFSRTDHVQLF